MQAAMKSTRSRECTGKSAGGSLSSPGDNPTTGEVVQIAIPTVVFTVTMLPQRGEAAITGKHQCEMFGGQNLKIGSAWATSAVVPENQPPLLLSAIEEAYGTPRRFCEAYRRAYRDKLGGVGTQQPRKVRTYKRAS